jgi:hypothetical protein
MPIGLLAGLREFFKGSGAIDFFWAHVRCGERTERDSRAPLRPDNLLLKILEVVTVKEDNLFQHQRLSDIARTIWLEKLQPFGERGYNLNSHIAMYGAVLLRDVVVGGRPQ